jgi:hypothetical protein
MAISVGNDRCVLACPCSAHLAVGIFGSVGCPLEGERYKNDDGV